MSHFCVSKVLMILLLLTFVKAAKAQKTNGTVKSLVQIEEHFTALVKKKGLNKAYIEIAANKGVIFKPNAVNIKNYYNQTNPEEINLTKIPNYAMISKDGYFGFTSGLIEITTENNTMYGHYLSIWKASTNKTWELELDANIKHPKQIADIENKFIDPPNYKYPKLIGPKKIKMREDIIFSTDLLFGKALKGSGNKHFNEFYADDVRLYFPESLPLISKQEAINFIDKKNQQIVSNPNFSDRAISGDLAYTNGKASIGLKKYNYVRVWRADENMKWNIIIDLYMPE
ncbi:hypothetical protein [Pedobacter alpinus]|uniref:Nuclear transport factor 2 family protein n=1 Tax=Pedobacter alpinus TaxID=1590643 RepID=A0ABW5TMQ6_9SPHI